ncbi:hypothetical protein NPIL_602761 [Nephila pilipes]|uniref:Uncharacterized protein n=1 Tax=Nephila pilipes TaxID=299642 RepID=A0A8X6P2I2_NEPPI|nr:hypothetical protein NPIL_602761 [Nephila pilipes]
MKKECSLINLTKLLKAKVEGEARLKPTLSGFDSADPKERFNNFKRENKNRFKSKERDKIVTAAGFPISKDCPCNFCGKTQESKNCYDAVILSLDEKE